MRGRIHNAFTDDEGVPSGDPYDLITTETTSMQNLRRRAGASVPHSAGAVCVAAGVLVSAPKHRGDHGGDHQDVTEHHQPVSGEHTGSQRQ